MVLRVRDNPLPDRAKRTYPETLGDDIGVCCHCTVTMLSYDGWLLTDQAQRNPMAATVLVVEDEPAIQELIS